jgi:hypothetical protein
MWRIVAIVAAWPADSSPGEIYPSYVKRADGRLLAIDAALGPTHRLDRPSLPGLATLTPAPALGAKQRADV